MDLGCMAPEAAPPGLRLGAAPPPGLKEVNSWLLLRCMGLTGLSIMLSCLEGMRLHNRAQPLATKHVTHVFAFATLFELWT